MDKVTETTRTVTVSDFVYGPLPAVLITEEVSGPGGGLRLFKQKIQVQDRALWERLLLEATRGNTISATIKTVWPDSGRYYTCLGDFTVLEVSATSAEMVAVA